MATIPDSVKAQLDADWTGAGGVEPTYYVEEDFRINPPLGQDAVWILSSTLDTDPVPFNDTFVTEKHVLEMVVNTLTSEDRLKELGDEVVRILNATAITDITYQRLKRRKITSGVEAGIFNYQEVITYDLQQQMKSSAAAYGAGATGDFTITGDLIVGGDDIKDSGSNIVLSFDGAGNIDVVGTITGGLTLDTANLILGDADYLVLGDSNDCLIRFNGANTFIANSTGGLYIQNTASNIYFDTGDSWVWRDQDDGDDTVMSLNSATEILTLTKSDYSVNAALMLGSANAAYVPMSYNGSNVAARYTNSLGVFLNTGASDLSLDFILPLPCTKGSLKLYLKNLKYGIQDADADDFTNTVYIYGHNGNTSTQLDIDNTNTIAAADVTFAGAVMPAAAIDVSSYQSVTVYIVCSNTDANDLDIANVRMECYYA